MSVKTYSLAKDGNKNIAENFKVREFACKDGSDPILIAHNMVDLLQIIRNYFGGSIHVNSGYRNLAYNRKIGSTDRSHHTKGRAADIVVRNSLGQIVSPVEVAKFAQYIGAGGVGRYGGKNSEFTHVDDRDKIGRWVNFGVEQGISSHGTIRLPVIKTVTVTASSLNVRRAPTTDTPSVSSLPKGKSVGITLVYGDWGKVDGEGWIHLGYTSDKPTETTVDYVVKKGDSPWSIAREQLGNGSRSKEIEKLNGLSGTYYIYEGQILKIPAK